jgi:CheY-like chemotaxis protein
MNRDVQSRIFEPFFTTKDVGQGTGLGLATVYGIVKQNDGFIDLYSEPGHGTIFKIYIPRHAGESPEMESAKVEKIPCGHGETILIVEDEPLILEVGKTMLESLGYVVLTASTPDEAMSLVGKRHGQLDLVITDVIMPKMNGRVLAERIRVEQPELRCLFMSGYTANVIVHQGVLDEGVQFLQKPFTMAGLAAKVREALGRSASGHSLG